MKLRSGRAASNTAADDSRLFNLGHVDDNGNANGNGNAVNAGNNNVNDNHDTTGNIYTHSPANHNGFVGTPEPLTPEPDNVVALRPHNKYALILMKTLSAALVILYFIMPIMLRANPWILTEITFLHRVTWPPFLNLGDPTLFGLNYTHNFQINTTDGVTLGVWHVLPTDLETEPKPSPDSCAKLLSSSGHPIILYFHGNAGTRGGWHRVRLYKLLSSLGFHVIAFDYRGYAESTGSPSEEGVYQDAITVYKWALNHGSAPIFIWGHSLGTGVATKVAKSVCDQGLPLKGLILEAPFNNIQEAYQFHPLAKPFALMPWFTWAVIEGVKKRDIHFTSDISIADVTVKTLILHAQDDGIIPYELGQKLYQAALKNKRKGSVRFIGFDGTHGYGHKHIHKSPELPAIIRTFVNGDE